MSAPCHPVISLCRHHLFLTEVQVGEDCTTKVQALTSIAFTRTRELANRLTGHPVYHPFLTQLLPGEVLKHVGTAHVERPNQRVSGRRDGTKGDLAVPRLAERQEAGKTAPNGLRCCLHGDLMEVISSQLTFYASYHSNPVNIAIHMVCIPMILW